jgi:hypothetical protein
MRAWVGRQSIVLARCLAGAAEALRTSRRQRLWGHPHKQQHQQQQDQRQHCPLQQPRQRRQRAAVLVDATHHVNTPHPTPAPPSSRLSRRLCAAQAKRRQYRLPRLPHLPQLPLLTLLHLQGQSSSPLLMQPSVQHLFPNLSLLSISLYSLMFSLVSSFSLEKCLFLFFSFQGVVYFFMMFR